MMLGHVIFKVNDLTAAVGTLRARGLTVEYGTVRKPHNALVYFSEGPYLELLERTGVPSLVKRLVSRTGLEPRFRRFVQWDEMDPGWCGLCLEGSEQELRDGASAFGNDGWMRRLRRVDTHGRTLRYTAFFPTDPDLPFLMSHFSTDPRPRGYTHPNGARRITRVDLPLVERHHGLVQELCPDPALHLIPPGCPMRVLFDNVPQDVLDDLG